MPKKKCSWLKFFDNFGLAINFQINQEDNFRSRCGGASFLIFAILAIVYIGYTFYLFVTRKNFTIVYSDKIVPQAPFVNLTAAEFKMAFGIFFLDDYSPATEAMQEYLDYNITLFCGSEMSVRNIEIPLQRCKYEDFTFITKDLFDFNGIGEMLCPNLTGQNFTLAGYWTEKYYRTIDVTISIKDDYLQSLDEVKALLEKKQLFAIAYIKDIAIDYDRVDNPIIGYLNNFQIYIDANLGISKTITLAPTKFESDTNILYNDPVLVTNVTSNLLDSHQNFRISRDSNAYFNNILAKFEYISSSKIISISRSYQKFPSYLADTSGLLSQALFLLYIVMTYLNQQELASILFEKTMKFRGNKKFDADYLTNIFKNKCSINSPKKGSCTALSYKDNEPTNLMPLYLSPDTKRRSTIYHSSLMINTKKIIHGRNPKKSFWPCIRKIPLETTEKKVGEERISYFLSIFTYMRKIQEIDILKYLFLTKDQKNIINFLSKPTMHINNVGSDLYKEYLLEQKSSNKLNREECERIIQSYQVLAAQENQTLIEKKLMTLFETEIELLNNK